MYELRGMVNPRYNDASLVDTYPTIEDALEAITRVFVKDARIETKAEGGRVKVYINDQYVYYLLHV